MDEIESVARAIANEVGDLLRRAAESEQVIHFKGAVDLVTETDRTAERLIVDRIRQAFPDHRIVAEEGTGASLDGRVTADQWVWYVDPLDGTTNFAHGHPHFSVSIAAARGQELRCGIVHDPLRRETFVANRGRGSSLNDRPIAVSRCTQLDQGLIGTGFPYDRRERADYYLAYVAAVLRRAQGIRRAGSAALDLCYVASGRLDGYWELKLSPWDVAAGILIVEEAGGRVSDNAGAPVDLYGAQVVASNGLIHDQLLEVLNAVNP
jgi:myo-inositol-1(or 4)-monophosphatase